ncbi:MAG: aminoglycoside 6-adenylyltransferase [Acidimicrobiales bacterium]
MDHDRVLGEILRWAAEEENVRAVVLTGSAALGPEFLDDLSDLDVELYANDPSRLLGETAWYEQFGEVLAVEALLNPGWWPTRLVQYVGGKVDFMVGPVDALGTAPYHRRFRVLLDKDKLAEDLPRDEKPEEPPVAAAFEECTNLFYSAVLMCAKCVVRDEPWLAKLRDWDAKQQLLAMIEWDHKARHGWSYETWYNGKNLQNWADADVRAALGQCWGPFELSETADALIETVALFETLSSRTARVLGLEKPDTSRVRAELRGILARADRHP